MNVRSSRNEPPSKSRREKRRQEIVEAAARLFAAEGYAGCEMERLALELQVAKGTLYLYFSGKQDLFFACVDWGMSQMQQTVRAAAERESDPYQRLAKGIRAYLAFFEQHPEYVELLIQERAIFKNRKQPTYFEYRNRNLEYWKDQYRALIDSGRLRDDLSVERIVDTVGSVLYGMMFTNHFIGRSVSLDEQYAALLEILFGGLRSERERHPAAHGGTTGAVAGAGSGASPGGSADKADGGPSASSDSPAPESSSHPPRRAARRQSAGA